MNKKIFAGVTALTMMMSGVLCGCSEKKETKPASSNAASASNENSQANTGFTYTFVTSDGSSDSYLGLEKYEGGVVITGYVGNETDLIIPEQIDGKPVVGINELHFVLCGLPLSEMRGMTSMKMTLERTLLRKIPHKYRNLSKPMINTPISKPFRSRHLLFGMETIRFCSVTVWSCESVWRVQCSYLSYWQVVQLLLFS